MATVGEFDGGAVIDLGATLRGLRRQADLSQRQLAQRSGMPVSTVARIESGAAANPGFRTVARLVSAAGGSLTAVIGTPPSAGPPSAGPPAAAPAAPESPDPPLDAAGRRYPAHLDVRPVREAADWWGAWWARWYDLPRRYWPREPPEHTFDLDRDERDRRRRREHGQSLVPQLTIEPPPEGGAPANVWRLSACDHAGTEVGRIGGFVRWRRWAGDAELVVADVEVAAEWRGCGLGRRLVDTLRDRVAAAGVRRMMVVLDEPLLPHRFFDACGFRQPVPYARLLMAAVSPGNTGSPGNTAVTAGQGNTAAAAVSAASASPIHHADRSRGPT